MNTADFKAVMARARGEDVKVSAISQENARMMDLQPYRVAEQAMEQMVRQQPNLALQSLCRRTIRDAERLYRAKLAVRLGLAEDDIRAVFDLSADELALLRAEVAAG